MCLAIPMKLTKRDGERGTVELGGVSMKIMLTLVPDAKPDDYVVVHAGYALSIVDETSASESLAIWHEFEASRS